MGVTSGDLLSAAGERNRYKSVVFAGPFFRQKWLMSVRLRNHVGFEAFWLDVQRTGGRSHTENRMSGKRNGGEEGGDGHRRRSINRFLSSKSNSPETMVILDPRGAIKKKSFRQ